MKPPQTGPAYTAALYFHDHVPPSSYTRSGPCSASGTLTGPAGTLLHTPRGRS